ncbi:alkaline phosphatase [Litorihabitans aurantiacus]|uniref:Alkaline phosphatase n=1 Tax=Litorihabitans aurantiacus TaxID=1930061 RepID=A0AA37XBP8_9MICO|nr:alkaline phosphatase [Litorihabitans aurantiacus]GMA31349.1 hypothetical protein GCM10025875_13410 [Litorihabitans aurantiacus]
MSSTSRRRAAAIALLAGAALAVPAAAWADPTDHGGAARLDGDQTQAVRDALVEGPATNVILLIGDGMGDSEITVARNYAEGAAGTLAGIDALPLTGQYTTWALTADGLPNYASESASTASAWSTGTKTVNGRLSVDVEGAPQPTLLELARANGLRTGNVTTSEIQDATSGAQVSHVGARSCYGPEDMAACAGQSLEEGGLGSISEQLLNVRPDVTLGGGAETFDQVATGGPWAGATLRDQARERGYQVVGDVAGLDAVTAADATRPVLGLFTPGNFPVRYTGPEATIGGGDLDPVTCTENPERLDSDLSLGSLTSKAIELLDSSDGFFLQVEGASIDKRDHAADACGQIGETVDLDEAVQVALDFARQDGETLVVVTADHAHTSQIVGSTPPGPSVHLLTQEGVGMIVSYGTSELGESMQHTGAQVRIAGYGPGAANVLGLTDQTDLFFTSARTLELDADVAALSADATLTLSSPTVAPGASVTAQVTGLAADWQATTTLADAAVAEVPVDVLDGGASVPFTAPAEPGTYRVAVTGAQTGTVLAADLVVSPTATDAPTTPVPTEVPTGGPVPSDAPTDVPTDGAGAGTGGRPGPPLSLTGADVAGYSLIAAALLVGGTGLAVWRRRQLRASV